MQQLLVNRRAEEGHNFVLLNNLVDSVAHVAYFAINKAHCEVLRPLAWTEDPQDAYDNGEIVILLDDFLPGVVRGLG